ncbi:AAA family ATPase [Pacificibacter sp.]|uniref:AAA family ATPase n=1 Tax=Pacificibacter sp. TaxID=1917866 RepID=UPI00321B595C
MKISRVQVEEGFLDGLDLRLSAGLNTIIGARGTGKTSLVELIRFGVGSPTDFDAGSAMSDDHARAVLGSGQVTVTLQTDEGKTVVSSRSAHEEEPRASESFSRPIVFSQTEIETLGKSKVGRLGLIDRFVSGKQARIEEETSLISRISSQTAEITHKSANLKNLESEWSRLPELERELAEIEGREESVKKTSEAMSERYEQLKKIHGHISRNAVLEDHLKRFLEISGARVSSLQELEVTWGQLVDPSMFHDDLAVGKDLLAEAIQAVSVARAKLGDADLFFRSTFKNTESERVSLEASARALRTEIERAEAGFGEISRAAQRLRDKVAQLSALSSIVEEEKRAIAKLQVARGQNLDRLTTLRKLRFDLRSEVADTLNSKLSPAIKIVLENAADIDRYQEELTSQLRGSGLRYGEIVSDLSLLVEPRELVEWIEANNFEALSDALNVTIDRSVRLISALEKVDLGKLVGFPIEDTAAFYLLDGADAKPIAELSLGQRCTVVLPIVLQLTDAVIVLDQPEDHIDNAFIAETLIRAIKDRATVSQLIVTTHNANIPVLGEAQQVVMLASDGKRGFVSFSKKLMAAEAVEAISSLMEGGQLAFQTRAKFYGDNE